MEPTNRASPSLTTLSTPPPKNPKELNWGERIKKLFFALIGTVTVIPLFFKGKKICSLYKEFATGQQETAQRVDELARETFPNAKRSNSPPPSSQPAAQKTEATSADAPKPQIQLRTIHPRIREALSKELKLLLTPHEHGFQKAKIPEKLGTLAGKEVFTDNELEQLKDAYLSHENKNDPFIKSLSVFIACFFANTAIQPDPFDYYSCSITLKLKYLEKDFSETKEIQQIQDMLRPPRSADPVQPPKGLEEEGEEAQEVWDLETTEGEGDFNL